eukprot:7254213-Prymnesium_polylepis.1
MATAFVHNPPRSRRHRGGLCIICTCDRRAHAAQYVPIDARRRGQERLKSARFLFHKVHGVARHRDVTRWCS